MPALRKQNRIKNTLPSTGLFWCDKCDGNLVGSSSKCGRCGYQDKRKRAKPDAMDIKTEMEEVLT